MKRVLFFIIITSSILYGENFDNISFITEDYPPYNFIENSHLKGISIDILYEIFIRSNHRKSMDNIKLLPWARGYTKAINEKDTCLFLTAKTEYRDKLFKWVGPVDKIDIAAITVKNSGIDLRNYKIGAVIKDVGEQLLIESGINKDSIHRLSGESSIYRGLKMLEQGRFDILVYGKKGVLWNLKNKELSVEDFDFLYTLKTIELYYAFNIETSDIVIDTMQMIFDELKEDETLQKILDKY